MKTRSIGLVLILLSLVATRGWAGDHRVPASTPLRVTTTDAAAKNNLQVYTANRKAPERDLFLEVYIEGNPDLDASLPAHTDYSIYSSTGKLIKKVSNAKGRNDATPALVTLPPGSYQIKALAQDDVAVTVPLVIKEGRTTVVFLDRDWKEISSIQPPTEVVHLRQGTLLYWKQQPMELAKGK